MLSLIAWSLSICLILDVLIQSLYAICFVWTLRRVAPCRTESGDFPRTAILVGLKGADPFLAESLRRLVLQDYPDYELHICIDSRNDPAWDIVHNVVSECQAQHVYIQEYRHAPEDGRINSTTSKQVQLLRQLDESFVFLAMADADMMPHPQWLKTLVQPMLREQDVGATFGNRWFMPNRARFGSLIRYAWNAGAVVYMWAFGMPWGGCFAIRADIVHEMNLLQKWSRVIAFDAMTKGCLREVGMKLRFVPQLMMINREECSVPFCLNFFQRQLTWTKLYHGDWPMVVLSNTVLTLLVLGCLFAAMAGGVTGDGGLALAGLSGFVVYLGGMLAMLVALEATVRRSLVARGEDVRWLSPAVIAKIVFAPPVAQLFQFVAMILALTRRQVRWRGDVMEIRGPYDLRMIKQTAGRAAAPDEDTSL